MKMLSEIIKNELADYLTLHYFPSTCIEREGVSQPVSDYSTAAVPALTELDAGFSETVVKMALSRYEKDSDFYLRANLTRQTFNIMKQHPEYLPTRQTAFACAIGLQLGLDETRDLLARAGYAISHSSKMDVIIEYFIRSGEYDIQKINEALYDYDQPLLGNY